VGADPNAAAAAIDSIIADLRTNPVSERELTKARNQILKRLITANLKVESRADVLGEATIILGDPGKANEQLADIRKVTAHDILRVAAGYLAPERALKGIVVEKTPQEKAAVEPEPPLTAKRETSAPAPGRDGLTRPDGWPERPPIQPITALSYDPVYSRTVLPNGMTVMVVANHSVPFVSMQLNFLGGAWTEEKPGAASMAMQMLTKGTQNYTEAELADELETYAISLTGSATMDTAGIVADCLSEYAPKALRLMSEVAIRPLFPEDQFERLRQQVLTSLAVQAVRPEYIADRELRRRLYDPAHPYSRTVQGEPADIEKLAVTDARHWWQTFVRPDMATLIFAGDISQTDAVALAKAVFGDWKAVGPKPQTTLPAVTELDGVRIYLVDRPGSTQSQIRVGGRGIIRKDPGFFVSRLVSSYFGWGFNSRLNRSIRVEKGLTYSVWGSFIAQRFAGTFQVGTFTRTESTAKAVQAVLDEIRALKEVPPTEDEVEVNRSYITGNLIIDRQTPQAIAADLWLVESQGLPRDYLKNLLAAVAVATIEDCRNFVQKAVRPDDLIVVVVGDAEKLKEELEKIAPTKVTTAPKDADRI
ncbi:MAG TPA: insulinase family protein, partial [Sedimentisphaerales bacterium]|nr:insulinase family protein [Sedimentisphaerales bacterium]